MHDSNLFSTEHIELVGVILIPIGSGILYLIRLGAKAIRILSRMELKVDTMWDWYTNHGSDITGYQPGDEHRMRQK